MPLMKLKTLLLALKAYFSPFAANALFLYFLKTSENNRQVFWVFFGGGGGKKKGALGRMKNGLNSCISHVNDMYDGNTQRK